MCFHFRKKELGQIGDSNLLQSKLCEQLLFYATFQVHRKRKRINHELPVCLMTPRVCGLPKITWDGGRFTGFQKGNFKLIPILLLQSEKQREKEIWPLAFPSLAENFKEFKLKFLAWSSLLNSSVFLNNCIPVFEVKKVVPYWVLMGWFVYFLN